MIKIFAFSLVTLFAFSASANTVIEKGTPLQEKQQLRAELLNYIQLTNIDNLHTKVRIKFLVNSNDEIVVLNVKTNQRYVERMIKSQLNYKKVKTDLSKKNQIYYIDVTFDVG